MEKPSHFADETLLRFGGHFADVSIREEVVAQDRRVCQRLHDAVHEASVAQVDQTSQSCRRNSTIENNQSHSWNNY